MVTPTGDRPRTANSYRLSIIWFCSGLRVRAYLPWAESGVDKEWTTPLGVEAMLDKFCSQLTGVQAIRVGCHDT
jgi:hypothetical protein